MRVAGLLVVVALVLACGASYAQQVETGPNVLLRGGAFRPFDSVMRDDFGSTWYDLGADFRVASGRRIDHYVGVGWQQARGRTFAIDPLDIGIVDPLATAEADTDLWVIPLTYTQRTRPNPSNKLYVGGGAGIYFSRGKLDATATVDGEVVATEAFRKSDTNIGVFALGGVAFTDTFRMELKYQILLRDMRVLEIDGSTVEEKLHGLSLSLVGAF